ncbi:translocation protein SEC72, partial [Phenoliferia sp. Uapishka_3]
PQVAESPVTFVPLTIDPSPSTLSHVSYSGPPPPGFTDADLTSLNSLSHILLLNPHLIFPGKPEPVPNQRSTEVNKHKEDGNLYFRNRDYPEAIKHYTLSADKAAARPVFEANVYARDEIAITVCNRSAAHYLMGNFVEALVDANAVIALKRPWVKGHFRKGKALQGLGRLEESREAFLLGLQFDPTAEDLSAGVAEVDKLLQERYQKEKSL